MSRTRAGFWSEAVYSKAGALLPSRVRRGNESVKWSIHAIVGELIREPGHCGHVPAPAPPTHIWGLPPDELREREQLLSDHAARITTPYERGGVTMRRRQNKSVPTLLIAVASWPDTNIASTPLRERWERRVVRAAQARWGRCLRGVYAHTDEARYHLHLWVDANGYPVKDRHAGFSEVQHLLKDKPAASRKEQATAYKVGVVNVLDWYHHWVGKHFGMERKGLTPRPRLSRAAALRDRQEKIDAAEALAIYEKRMIARAKAEVMEHTQALQKALARLRAREEAVERKSQAVAHMRDAVEDQLRLEERLRSDLVDGPSVF